METPELKQHIEAFMGELKTLLDKYKLVIQPVLKNTETKIEAAFRIAPVEEAKKEATH